MYPFIGFCSNHRCHFRLRGKRDESSQWHTQKKLRLVQIFEYIILIQILTDFNKKAQLPKPNFEYFLTHDYVYESGEWFSLTLSNMNMIEVISTEHRSDFGIYTWSSGDVNNNYNFIPRVSRSEAWMERTMVLKYKTTR